MAAPLTFALALALVVAGCSSSKHHDASSTTTAHPSSSTSSSADTTSSTSGSGSTTTSGATTTSRSGPPACATSQLAASLGASQGAAGHVITPILLTNHSGTTCILSGYPGVSLLDSGGTQIGIPATRSSRPTPVVSLAPGKAAEADLETQDQGVATSPCWAPSASVKVFPPDQLAALTTPGVVTVCGNELTVTPMATPTS